MSLNSTETIPTRNVARVIVLDACNSVLLVRYREYRKNRPGSFWATPGGQLEPGERAQAAALRELREETGLSANLERKLWDQTFTFELPQGLVNQHEEYFLVRLRDVSPAAENSSNEAICEHHWWSLAELQSTTEVIYPDGLAANLQALIGADSNQLRSSGQS